jgi:hypothetical protein
MLRRFIIALCRSDHLGKTLNLKPSTLNPNLGHTEGGKKISKVRGLVGHWCCIVTVKVSLYTHL